MTRVAFLAAACMLEGSDDPRSDAFEHALEFPLLREGCAEHGVELVEQVWNAPDLDASAFDACVIGTTWDYMDQRAAFEARLAEIAARCPLFNPLEVVRWNLDKRYLAELAERGAPVVPTRSCERVDAATLEAAFDEFGCDELVVKPLVGAGAWRQARVRRGEPLPAASELPPAEALVQPFLAGIETHGELSFVFIDGDFSHAARKLPAPNDYRVQSMFGGREVAHDASAPELQAARRALTCVDAELLYARVDMLPDASGALLVMELELVEPYLYPEQGPQLGARFGAALARRLR
ncbi:MAG: ATP-grasp domain protein [Planctomycetota bacterium]|nr:MAG: ATP-grasp domain protein [Planctomycetota bacterium]